MIDLTMRSPNFNQTKRSEAIAYSKDEALGERVNNILESFGSLPEPHTEAAHSLQSELKPVFYAALAQVIEDMIDFEAPPLPRNHPEVTKIISFYPSDRDEAALLDLFLRNKFISHSRNYFDSYSQTAKVLNLQSLININKRLGSPSWDEAQLAMHGGLDTMLSHIEICFRAYYPLAQKDERDLDEVAVSMRRSFSDIINATLLNTLQLLAISIHVSRGMMPQAIYDEKENRYRFQEELDQTELTEDVKKLLIDNLLTHAQPELIATVESASRIADLTQNTDTLGCPVTFKPEQVQKLWGQAIDQAETIGLL